MKRSTLLLLLAAILSAQAAQQAEINAEPHHHLVLSNDQVRVFNVEIAPHSETLMHWHRHDYIYVQLGDAEVVNAVQGRPPVTVKLHDGQTGFLPATFAHVARNVSDRPYHNVTAEILEDDKLRQSQAHWDEERGLEILQGGTQEILFVKDDIRVSEFELQPGGAVPVRDRSGPCLLVAVTDLELYLTDPRARGGHEPMPPASHFKSGDATWLRLGFRHPIVNAGHTVAKFVTLEFPARRQTT